MKKILLISIFICLLAPVMASAALTLEQDYPSFGDQELVVGTPLPEVIKYLVSFAILIGALAAFASLIYAGIGYLTSTGMPNKMSAAKTGIYRSLLGLTILLGSYLVLLTVNPQLLIMHIERIPIESGILLLSADTIDGTDIIEGGYTRFTTNNRDDDPIKDIINDGKAKIIPSGISDCAKEYGKELVVVKKNGATPKIVSFEDFPLGGFVFLGDAWQKFKLVVYSEKNFEGESQTYQYTDKPGEQEAQGLFEDPDVPGDPLFSKVLLIENGVVVESGGDPYTVRYPPFSLKILGIGPGVYLYSDKEGVEQYFLSSKPNFEASNIDFNDEATAISIQNRKTDETVDTYDYLSILFNNPNYSGVNYSGEMRVFFREKEREIPYWNSDTAEYVYAKITDVIRGNILFRTEFNEGSYLPIDAYGKMEDKKASSIFIKELSADHSVCKEVRICSEPEYGREVLGECISYTPDGTPVATTPEEIPNIKVTLPLPVYIPQNVGGTIRIPPHGLPANDRVLAVDLTEKIKSIYINGDCLVALFEKKVHPDRNDKCIVGPGITVDPAKCWDGGGGPGKYSEIFTQSDYDLSGNQTYCGWTKKIGFGEGSPCSSSIAIYPIKKGY